jgi:hypothetical protein
MKSLRRFLVIQALALWQGGFLFYATFVVPVGTSVLGSSAEQGAITRRVTDYLNACGVAALLVCLWDLVGRHRGIALLRCRWLLWLAMALILGGLIVLHVPMESLLDDLAAGSASRSHFRALHRLYLWLSTAQWLLALGYVYLTLRAWRQEDQLGRFPQ